MQLAVFVNAGAGNLYGVIPTVLVATQRDGQPAELRRLLHVSQSEPSTRCLASFNCSNHTCGGEYGHPIRAGAGVHNVSQALAASGAAEPDNARAAPSSTTT